MRYCLCIDWLALFCNYMPVGLEQFQPESLMLGDLFSDTYRVQLMNYGTRQFSKLHTVAIPNAEGGWDDFAEIQSAPYDKNVLPTQAIIIRFSNRALYLPDFWKHAEAIMQAFRFKFLSISRIDICADFNDFATYSPQRLIDDFAAKRLRHIGRGVGALYFNHGVVHKEYGVNYTGLSFGTHGSDARVYLYNKTFELDCVKDKPYIKDMWVQAGLDVRHVWRLEVSIKSKACKFKDRETKEQITISKSNVCECDDLAKIYHTFVKKLFAFVKNRKGITNITREPRIVLFEGAPAFDRCVIRNVSCSSRIERILLKKLYQLGDLYRGANIKDIAETAQMFAFELADATDLSAWMARKVGEWEKPNHK